MSDAVGLQRNEPGVAGCHAKVTRQPFQRHGRRASFSITTERNDTIMETTTRVEKPTSEDIGRLAYLIWEREGQPQGRQLDHWLQAESILMALVEPAEPVVEEAAPIVVPVRPVADVVVGLSKTVKPVKSVKPKKAGSRRRVPVRMAA